jgi:HEAT repeat protein
VPVLARAVRDPDAAPSARAAACGALGRTGSSEATAALVAVLEARGEPHAVRAAAAEALGRQGRRDAADAVAKATGDPSRAVAAAASLARVRIDHLAN